MGQHDLDLEHGDAAIYALLTIGDGLVAQTAFAVACPQLGGDHRDPGLERTRIVGEPGFDTAPRATLAHSRVTAAILLDGRA